MRDLTDAATNGTRKDVLIALRDRIAAEIEAGVPARDLKSLSLELREITKELDDMNAGKEASRADELAAARAARRAGAKAPRSAKG